MDDLVSEGVLDAECERIFRIKYPDDPAGLRLRLHQHKADAIKIARRNESYVITTGTGSGKSLGYFIPIIDDVLRRKRTGNSCHGITAIVVYPMNALCNSQREELEKYLQLGYGEGREPVTFARYTGQESETERDRIAKNPPDILLTNYVMLELLMTRFHETDKAVRKHAAGLRFLMLDELHTYRGRQGADVAMLVRRVRERFNDELLCIGTSATMASEGSVQDRNTTVAHVASRLFGVTVDSGSIVSETLEPVTCHDTSTSKPDLRQAIGQGVPENPAYDDLSKHPVAVWVERKLGLEETEGTLFRKSSPLTIQNAAEHLSKDSSVEQENCRSYLKQFLLTAYNSRNDRGVSLFAFRLHQFISGAWNAYSTLEAPDKRYVTLEGQQFSPGDRNRLLFSLSFCRECGQEYFPVWARIVGRRPQSFEPRDLSERANDDEDTQLGYLVPSTEGMLNPDDMENQFPEEWLEHRDNVIRIKPHFRRHHPLSVQVNTLGHIAEDGLPMWYIPESFRFCLNPDVMRTIGHQHQARHSRDSGSMRSGNSASFVPSVMCLKPSTCWKVG